MALQPLLTPCTGINQVVKITDELAFEYQVPVYTDEMNTTVKIESVMVNSENMTASLGPTAGKTELTWLLGLTCHRFKRRQLSNQSQRQRRGAGIVTQYVFYVDHTPPQVSLAPWRRGIRVHYKWPLSVGGW